MSELTNSVSLVGNVGAAPVARATTSDGKPIVGFAIAQSVLGQDPGTGKLIQKGTQWFQVSAFGRLAERVLGGLKKGDLVCVNGELRASTYTTKDGEKRSSVEIVAADVIKAERITRNGASPMPNFDDFDETHVSDAVAAGGPEAGA
jgi:single-strand DNA-binding protein